ncbi:MAG: riboflavin synthase [Candidatus Liptonbacteria bacterium]|nr:riboflavin synthase [Candidatus Liptonbacteria bacterium]
MFTGLIRHRTRVIKISKKGSSLLVLFSKPKGSKITTGDSLNLNGICSTVRKIGRNFFEVEYMRETFKLTTIRHWQRGLAINLESSLRLGDKLGGHLIQGHVEAVGQVTNIKKIKQAKVLQIKITPRLLKFILPKGSIAVDGVSLTVIKTSQGFFSVSLVSYTLNHTNLGSLKTGDYVNIETDILGRYLSHFLK